MYKTERVIVLRTNKYSESDLIVRTLSSEGEILSFIAKGAQKSKKRFVGGVLEPTRFIKVTYKDKKAADGRECLFFLKEAMILDGFDGIRSDYERLDMGFQFLKHILKVSQQGLSEATQLFILLGQALRSLETTTDLYKLKVSFEAQLLEQQGVCPAEVSPEFFTRSLRECGSLKWGSEQWARQGVMVESALKNYLTA